MFKCLLAIISVLFTCHANASQIKFLSTDDVVVTKVGINGSSFNNKNVAIGSYNLIEQGASSSVIGFCVDPFQAASSSYKSYVKSNLDATDFSNNGASRLSNVQKLFDNAYASLADDKYKTAGFHLALWEIFHDDLSLNSGKIFKVQDTDASVVGYANGYLSSLNGWQVVNKFDFSFYQSDKYQNYLVPSAVPLPAALPMFLSGLAGLGIMRKRKAA